MTSERDDSGVGGCFVIIMALAMLFVALSIVKEELTKRDNYIHDLQRRVGQLESAGKR